ncbi:MAG: CoA pyrophosphatase [Bacteroidetes bacterium]|nr:CoA pyrophosphatase [Bacteroidota bacterium]
MHRHYLRKVQDVIEKLRFRLTQPLPGRAAQARMKGPLRPMPESPPADARNSAVLQLLYPLNGTWNLALIRRVEDGGAHSGQISFPGGRFEPEDKSFDRTALRETEEEIGIPHQAPELLGALTPIYIPVSHFLVHPFVAWLEQRPQFIASPDEVTEVIETPLNELFDPRNKIETIVRPPSHPDLSIQVPAYRLSNDRIVWGATAMMLAEMEAVFQGL